MNALRAAWAQFRLLFKRHKHHWRLHGVTPAPFNVGGGTLSFYQCVTCGEMCHFAGHRPMVRPRAPKGPPPVRSMHIEPSEPWRR